MWAEGELKETLCQRFRHDAELTPVCAASETPLLAVLGAGVVATVVLPGNSPALSASVFRALASGSDCDTVDLVSDDQQCLGSLDGIPLLD